jgi:hypothetical protein
LIGFAVGLAVVVGTGRARADQDGSDKDGDLRALSAEWWQLMLSIPTADNPLIDLTGDKCMVGQRGATWFLGGVFGGGTATRQCSVPEGKTLFFPAVNFANIDTPNVCGQGPQSFSIRDLRAASASAVDGATNISVTLDGRAIRDLTRVKSKVFEVTFPEDNLFDAPCTGANLGNVPAGTFAPAVDDGIYAVVKPLPVGSHTLRIRSTNPDQDVTYHLVVVPVRLRD